MKNLLTSRRALATLLLGWSAFAAAQSLGPMRAEAWVGRPLEVSVPATFADGRECVHADVSYGDTRLRADQVRTRIVGAGPQQRVVIESDAPIDEPVVTIAVRAGCGNTFARTYTLLSEMQPAALLAAAHAPPRSVQPGGVISTALVALPQALAPAPAPLPTQVAGAAPARPLLRPALARAGDTAAPRPVVMKAKAVAPSRLRLENWEPDAQTLLRITANLTAPDTARRATAALLWQALNADPADLLRSSVALQKLEGELAQLRQIAGTTRSEMEALRRQLDAPQAATASARTAQFLGVLLLLAGAMAAWLWYRNQRGPAADWSGAPVGSVFDRLAPQPPRSEPVQPAPPQEPALFAPVADPVPAPGGAAAGAQGGAAAGARPQQPAGQRVQVRPPGRPAAADAPALPHTEASTLLRVETLAATFEEVDFLASLGLWNDAMDVLKTYLEDSSAPAPLAFFELMRLCVNTDDAATLVAVRKRYATVFRREAPKFDLINAGKGLQEYPELAARMTAAWGTPEALELIEQQLFTVPAPHEAISLTAGRELLFLHDLAMTLVRDDGAAQATDDGGHALAPWAHAQDPDTAQAVTQSVADVEGGHRFALDLDLNAVAEEVQPEDMAPGLLDEFQAAQRQEPEKRPPPAEEEDAFSAAVAFESRRGVGGR